MFFWWRDVVRESRTPGVHTPVVRLGLRYGMLFFISSEVMFFVGFFWAFFNFALFPDLQGNGQTVWPPSHHPHLRSVPPAVPQHDDPAAVRHHDHLGAPRAAGERDKKIAGDSGSASPSCWASASPLCQAIEYSDAPFKFVGGGVYPSTFFLATGFHGFHVIVGTCFLIVCWFRARADHFTPERHFGFEAAAWYWHFVDVVWLFLFTCIYWWGASPVLAAALTERSVAQPAASLLHVALACRCPRCGKGACSAICWRCAIAARSAASTCARMMPATAPLSV